MGTSSEAHLGSAFRYFTSALTILVGATLATGCIEELPDKIALAPGAENVEVISDPPNKDVYDAVGSVHTSVIATETTEAVRNAKNELRNQAARKGASFVSIDEVSSRASWDLRGRTVVTMSGTAFKAK